MRGRVDVIGIGPGDPDHMTPAARQAIETADVIVGYRAYLDLITYLAPETPRRCGGMRQEVARAQQAIQLAAAGRRVALVSSGDSGIYGMAGLVFEILDANAGVDVDVAVVPGVSALNAAAALLGAPLMTDFAAISLSDYLIPQADVLRRLEAAVRADFVLCMFNPCSRTRTEVLERALHILLCHRSPETPVGIVRNAYRRKQRITVIPLSQAFNASIDMRTIILAGNSQTTVRNGRMITSRGYSGKYSFGLMEPHGTATDENAPNRG